MAVMNEIQVARLCSKCCFDGLEYPRPAGLFANLEIELACAAPEFEQSKDYRVRR
jgi:hypothetical protein